MEMAHALARDLGVRVEFVRIEMPKVRESLDAGTVDIFMAGIAITPERLQEVAFSDPYLEATLCFIVPDHRRSEFSSREAVREHPSLRLGIPRVSYYADKIKRYLPQAEMVPLDSPRDFFKGDHKDLDALVFSAEGGSAWTLIYPEFSVAVPHPDLLKIPMGYVVRRGDPDLVEFLNHWILLKQRDLTIPRLFDYWILGQEPPSDREPRWSILHDVLGWGGAKKTAKSGLLRGLRSGRGQGWASPRAASVSVSRSEMRDEHLRGLPCCARAQRQRLLILGAQGNDLALVRGKCGDREHQEERDRGPGQTSRVEGLRCKTTYAIRKNWESFLRRYTRNNREWY